MAVAIALLVIPLPLALVLLLVGVGTGTRWLTQASAGLSVLGFAGLALGMWFTASSYLTLRRARR
jgi:hypothetical protein